MDVISLMTPPPIPSSDEVQTIVSGKLALKYSGANVDAMKSIAQASHNRSLADFQKV